VIESPASDHPDPVFMQRIPAVLTKLLSQATGKQVVVLIDEYDMPIHAGHHNGYYREIVAFMRNFLSGAFKDNPHLHKGVLTGILRIAKESIFSGFNNPAVHTILDEAYAEHFGFTEDEVATTLTIFDLTDRTDEVRMWYNGYQFGTHTIYNPWAIMRYVDNARFPTSRAEPYWINTSDNLLIKRLVVGQNAVSRNDLEKLLSSEPLIKELDSNIVLEHVNARALWSMLTFSGYLKVEKITEVMNRTMHQLAIPNLEVRTFYERTIRDWLDEQAGPEGMDPLLQALLTENIEVFHHHFQEIISQVLSFHDTAGKEPEKVYHTFMLGLLVNLRGMYQVRSNRESGFGRYDISLVPNDPTHPAWLFEFKVADGQDAKTVATTALQQIIDKDYAAEARAAGAARIYAAGVAVEGKRVTIETRLLPAMT
jgi:hypothetical protein